MAVALNYGHQICRPSGVGFFRDLTRWSCGKRTTPHCTACLTPLSALWIGRAFRWPAITTRKHAVLLRGASGQELWAARPGEDRAIEHINWQDRLRAVTPGPLRNLLRTTRDRIFRRRVPERPSSQRRGAEAAARLRRSRSSLVGCTFWVSSAAIPARALGAALARAPSASRRRLDVHIARSGRMKPRSRARSIGHAVR